MFFFYHSIKRQELHDYLQLEFLAGTKQHAQIQSYTSKVGVLEKNKLCRYIYTDHCKT